MRTCLFTDLTRASEINLIKKERRNYCAYWVTCLHTYVLPSFFPYLLNYLLIYSMVQSPSWEGNRLSVSQEVSRILWDPKVHYRDYKYPTPVPILGQIDPVLAHPSHLRFHRNIIPPSSPGSSTWFLALMFPHQNYVCTSSIPNTCNFPRLSHSSEFDHWGVQIIKFLIM